MTSLKTHMYEVVSEIEALLHQTGDETEAMKRAEKLVKKYGEEAMREKAEKDARKKRNRTVSCTGSKIRCSAG